MPVKSKIINIHHKKNVTLFGNVRPINRALLYTEALFLSQDVPCLLLILE